MKRDYLRAEDEIERDVQVPLTDRQDLALLDFIYNLGTGAFRSSRLLRKLNAADYAGAAADFSSWVRAHGHTMRSLVKRRQGRDRSFQEGYPMTGTVVEPVQVSDAAAAEVAALHAAVADLKATITGTVPRKVGAAFKNATARVAAKVPANTVAKVAYGGVMGAGSAIVAAPHVAAARATVIRWL